MKRIKLILKKYSSLFYTSIAKSKVKSYKEPFTVNYFSRFTKNTVLGKNTNFNGMKIAGRGLVTIGDNFHSGSECLLITQNHNYEGEKIPYDSTYIVKKINIEDNVWLGNRVIILGGVDRLH